MQVVFIIISIQLNVDPQAFYQPNVGWTIAKQIQAPSSLPLLESDPRYEHQTRHQILGLLRISCKHGEWSWVPIGYSRDDNGCMGIQFVIKVHDELPLSTI